MKVRRQSSAAGVVYLFWKVKALCFVLASAILLFDVYKLEETSVEKYQSNIFFRQVIQPHLDRCTE